MTNGPDLPDGFRLIAFDQIGSTSTEARRHANDGEAEGLVIWAREQLDGRGRQDRKWTSPPGNLYSSVLFRPGCAAASVQQLAFLPSLAVRDIIGRFAPEAPVKFKWPNDVLLAGGKVAGILLEAGPIQNGKASWLIIGCGVNLRTYPEGMDFPAASLTSVLGRAPEPHEALTAYLSELAGWYDIWKTQGFQAVRNAWLKSGHAPGDSVRVRNGTEIVTGRFHDLDDTGTLVLDIGGTLKHFATGDVFF